MHCQETRSNRLFETRPFQIHFSSFVIRFKTLWFKSKMKNERRKKNELSVASKMIKWLMQRECSCYQWTCQVILNCVSRKHPNLSNQANINQSHLLSLIDSSVLFENGPRIHFFFNFPKRKKRLEWTQARPTEKKIVYQKKKSYYLCII